MTVLDILSTVCVSGCLKFLNVEEFRRKCSKLLFPPAKTEAGTAGIVLLRKLR